MSKQKDNCLECGTEIEVNICCGDSDGSCGCRGLPTEPPLCSEECYDKWCSGRIDAIDCSGGY